MDLAAISFLTSFKRLGCMTWISRLSSTQFSGLAFWVGSQQLSSVPLARLACWFWQPSDSSLHLAWLALGLGTTKGFISSLKQAGHDTWHSQKILHIINGACLLDLAADTFFNSITPCSGGFYLPKAIHFLCSNQVSGPKT